MIVNKLFRRFASVDPHLRSINSLGINSRDIKFNITYAFLHAEFPNFTKSLSSMNHPLTLIPANLTPAKMGPSVRIRG